MDIIPNSPLGALEELQVQLNDLNKEENADLVAAWEKDPDYGCWYYILQDRPTIKKMKLIGDYMGKHFPEQAVAPPKDEGCLALFLHITEIGAGLQQTPIAHRFSSILSEVGELATQVGVVLSTPTFTAMLQDNQSSTPSPNGEGLTGAHIAAENQVETPICAKKMVGTTTCDVSLQQQQSDGTRAETPACDSSQQHSEEIERAESPTYGSSLPTQVGLVKDPVQAQGFRASSPRRLRSGRIIAACPEEADQNYGDMELPELPERETYQLLVSGTPTDYSEFSVAEISAISEEPCLQFISEEPSLLFNEEVSPHLSEEGSKSLSGEESSGYMGSSGTFVSAISGDCSIIEHNSDDISEIQSYNEIPCPQPKASDVRPPYPQPWVPGLRSSSPQTQVRWGCGPMPVNMLENLSTVVFITTWLLMMALCPSLIEMPLHNLY